MRFSLLPLTADDMASFKKDMQEAFQRGAAAEMGDIDMEILPETDIEQSLAAKGAAAYKAIVDGEMSGGVIVRINEDTQRNHLDFLYVKHGAQGRGVGLQIWQAVEALYPSAKVWETVTPYFEKRNIHFYINRCGFAAVEFFNPLHRDPDAPADMPGSDFFFRFEKRMQRSAEPYAAPTNTSED